MTIRGIFALSLTGTPLGRTSWMAVGWAVRSAKSSPQRRERFPEPVIGSSTRGGHHMTASGAASAAPEASLPKKGEDQQVQSILFSGPSRHGRG